jgi:predicted transcriptional regulator
MEKDAELLWTELKSLGIELSISAFNTRLKKLVELGLVKKRSFGYNKHLYSIFPDHQ